MNQSETKTLRLGLVIFISSFFVLCPQLSNAEGPKRVTLRSADKLYLSSYDRSQTFASFPTWAFKNTTLCAKLLPDSGVNIPPKYLDKSARAILKVQPNGSVANEFIELVDAPSEPPKKEVCISRFWGVAGVTVELLTIGNVELWTY